MSGHLCAPQQREGRGRFAHEENRYERSRAISLALRRKGGDTLPRDFIRFSRCASGSRKLATSAAD